MKCTVFQLVTVVLMFCVLFAGCSSSTNAKIKPLETTVSTPPPTTSTSTTTVISTSQPEGTLPRPTEQ